jgi:hypothetical protein
MSDDIYVLCAPADSKYYVPGSDFTHTCSKCGRRLMLAPTGQAFLKKNPHAKLVCPCSADVILHAKSLGLTVPRDQMLDELMTTKPNPHRNRN